MVGTLDVRLVVHNFHCYGRRRNFLDGHKLFQWAWVLGMCAFLVVRLSEILSTLSSGLSWSFTGSLRHCGHTVFLCSCLHLWLPSLLLRVIRLSCSWYAHPKMTPSPHSRKHGQVYLVGYLVTFTYAQSSKADNIVNKIRELDA